MVSSYPMSSAHWRWTLRQTSRSSSHRGEPTELPVLTSLALQGGRAGSKRERQAKLCRSLVRGNRATQPDPRRCLSAFTLVELLAVLAITAILLTFLVPRAKSSLEAARSAKCVGNLKQLGAQTMAYVADNGVYPAMIQQTNSVPVPGDFYEYIRNSPAKPCAICPSAKFAGYRNGRPQEGYGGNPLILVVSLNGTPPPVRPAQVLRPSEVILLTDGAQLAANGFALGMSTIWFGKFLVTTRGDPSQADTPLTDAEVLPGGFWDPDVSQIPLRHNGRANVLFCDGHVRSISAISDIKQKNIYWHY